MEVFLPSLVQSEKVLVYTIIKPQKLNVEKEEEEKKTSFDR